MFKAFINFIKRIFSKKTVDDLNAALIKAAPYVQVALPIVERIAILTPNRTDDEILNAFNSFGLIGLFDPVADKTIILRDLASTVIQKNMKESVGKSILNLAVELAYSAYKTKTN